MKTEVEMPSGIAKLPRDKHRRPVPWFVAWIDGVPDFRVIGVDKVLDAMRFDLCWVCGEKRGRWGTFVIGPMCAVNRVSPEPPSHQKCAEYSARTCPFLVTPNMVRREKHLPENHVLPPGEMITRNPGVALVWTSKNWRMGTDGLFDIGTPDRVQWYAEGREATHDEVMASITSGMPILQEMADDEGPRAQLALKTMYEDALKYVPKVSA